MPGKSSCQQRSRWLILLEAGTIVGKSGEKLRVAAASLEKKIVTKRNVFLQKNYYLVLPGYDPRIHALYFCPQLYRINSDNKLVPLDGEEIGKLVARSVRDGVVEKRPWYEPLELAPKGPVVGKVDQMNLDSLIVETPEADGKGARDVRTLETRHERFNSAEATEQHGTDEVRLPKNKERRHAAPTRIMDN